jgi:hypothetical protein
MMEEAIEHCSDRSAVAQEFAQSSTGRFEVSKELTRGCAAGLLLYPTNGYDVRDTMLVQGHRIDVATVNLAQPWPQIEKRLLDILAL